MKLSEAIRIVEKIKPWTERRPEWRAALDTLVAAVAQDGEPEPPRPSRTAGLFGRITDEMRRSLDEFTDSLFDLSDPDPDASLFPERAAPVREPVEIVDASGVRALPVGSIYVACSSTGMPERSPRTRTEVDVHNDASPLPADWTYYRVLYRAPASKPAAPKPGDEVLDEAAALKLPPGTLIKSPAPAEVRGLVVKSQLSGGVVVRWTDDADPLYPATIVDINVP